MKSPLCSILSYVLLAVFACAAPVQQEPCRVYLAGQIDCLPIQMELNSATAEGWYFYENRGASIRLSGTNRAGILQMEERSPGGKVSGFFDLRWDTRRLAGTWLSADRKRCLPVSLDLAVKYVELRDDFPEDYSHTRLMWPVFIQTNNPLARFLYRHSQAALRQLATEFRQLCKKSLAEAIKESGGLAPLRGWYLVAGFTVRYYSTNYICLVQDAWEDWADGGTPDRTQSLNYVWRNGKPMQVKLPSLLRTSQSSAQLAKLVVRDLRRQLGTNASHVFLPVRSGDSLADQAWAYRPGGLVFFFGPDESVVDGGGPAEVYLDRAGLLRPLLKGTDALRALALPAN